MTKSDVLAILNCKQADLARLLGITRAAVAQWPADEPIPSGQLLRLRHEIAPDKFKAVDVGAGTEYRAA